MTNILCLVARVVGSLVAFLAWAFLIAASCVITRSADAAPPTMRVYSEYHHRSDLFTGWPFRNAPGHEATEDTLSLGLAFEWPVWGVSVGQGAYSRECNISKGCDWQSGTSITVRRYFGPVILLTRRR